MESKLHLSTWQHTQCSRCHPPQPAVCHTPSDSHLQYITFNNLSPPLYMPHTLRRCVHSPLTEPTHFTKRNKLSTLSHQFYQTPLKYPASITDQISSGTVEVGHRNVVLLSHVHYSIEQCIVTKSILSFRRKCPFQVILDSQKRFLENVFMSVQPAIASKPMNLC